MRDPSSPSAERASGTEPEREARRNARLVAVFLLGTAGLVTPLLPATSGPATVGGLPWPFVFVFSYWLALIVLIALALSERRGDRP